MQLGLSDFKISMGFINCWKIQTVACILFFVLTLYLHVNMLVLCNELFCCPSMGFTVCKPSSVSGDVNYCTIAHTTRRGNIMCQSLPKVHVADEACRMSCPLLFISSPCCLYCCLVGRVIQQAKGG